MNDGSRTFEDRAAAYVDGVMTSGEAQQFEASLAGDAQLQIAIDRSRTINASLRLMFEPPSVPAWAQRSGAAELARLAKQHSRRAEQERDTAVGSIPMPSTGSKSTSGMTQRRWLAVAAAVALVTCGAVLAWRSLGIGAGQQAYDSSEYRTFAEVYEDLDGPQEVVESDDILAGMFAGRFGEAIAFDRSAPDVTLEGIAYCHTMSRDTMCLVGSDGQQKILVFVDRLERDQPPSLPAESGLHAYRRELGRLVLYEVSPIRRAMMVDWVYKKES